MPNLKYSKLQLIAVDSAGHSIQLIYKRPFAGYFAEEFAPLDLQYKATASLKRHSLPGYRVFIGS